MHSADSEQLPSLTVYAEYMEMNTLTMNKGTITTRESPRTPLVPIKYKCCDGSK